MKRKLRFGVRYQALLAIGLAMVVLSLAAVKVPQVNAVFPQDQELIVVGVTSVTTGDLFLVVATLGAFVDISTLIFWVIKNKG